MVEHDELAFAVEHFRRRAAAEDALRTAVETIPSPSDGSDAEREACARHMITTAQALRAVHRTTFEEHVYQASHWCIQVIVEDRIMAGVFADDLQPIQDAIGQIERRHGLAPDEYWLRDEGPDDWQVLNRTYDEIIERNCGEALRDMVWWTSRIF